MISTAVFHHQPDGDNQQDHKQDQKPDRAEVAVMPKTGPNCHASFKTTKRTGFSADGIAAAWT